MVAAKRGIDFEVTSRPMHELDRTQPLGFVKVLTRRGCDSILGVCIVAERGGEMIAEFALAMKYHLSLKKILAHSFHTEWLPIAGGLLTSLKQPSIICVGSTIFAADKVPCRTPRR